MASTLDYILDTNPYKPPKSGTGNAVTAPTTPAPQVTAPAPVTTAEQPVQPNTDTAVQQQPVQQPVQQQTQPITEPTNTETIQQQPAVVQPQKQSLGDMAAKPQPQRMSMAELYTAVNGGPPQKEVPKEELEKQEKRHKRNQMFAAIGDGIAALSNLYFTTQYAPNMFDPKNSLSQQEQARYDKIKAANDKVGDKYIQWYNGYMKALDADKDNEQKAWERKRAEQQDQRAQEKDEAQREQWRQQFNFNVSQAAEKGELDRLKIEEGKRQFDEKLKQGDRHHNDDIAVQRERIAASSGGGSGRKRLGFTDGDKNQVSVHEDVWSASMQAVYDELAKELEPAEPKEKASYNNKLRQLDTAQKKEDFVKQNWYKGPRSRGIMLVLSKLDPSTMDSRVQQGDSLSDDNTASGPDWGRTQTITDPYSEWARSVIDRYTDKEDDEQRENNVEW